MEWIVALGVFILLAVALPPAIVAAKRSVRGNGRLAGVALSIGLAFSFMVDPRKRETVDQIAKRDAEDSDADSEHQPEPKS